MKIYFAASIRGGRTDATIYHQLIDFLNHDHTVLNAHVGDPQLSTAGESQLSDAAIRDRDVAWLMQSDVVVAETTTPSLGVGYELALAEHAHKPVLILHHANSTRLSAMIAGTPYFDHIFPYRTVAEAKRDLAVQLAKLA